MLPTSRRWLTGVYNSVATPCHVLEPFSHELECQDVMAPPIPLRTPDGSLPLEGVERRQCMSPTIVVWLTTVI